MSPGVTLPPKPDPVTARGSVTLQIRHHDYGASATCSRCAALCPESDLIAGGDQVGVPGEGDSRRHQA
ncbi:hypothetical protein GCM10009524_53330 [Spirilliplanes yamanashiensis]